MEHETAEATEQLARVNVPEIDALLGHEFRVLDNGFVRVVDYMGGDASIVQAARVSYGAGTRHVHEDRGLIRYLMRHWHTTPFEMAELKLHVRVPMDCWRQWIRHRTASVNEYSTRYSIAIDSAQCTPPDQWREQATGNRQGSGGMLDQRVGAHLSAEEGMLHRHAHAVYDKRIRAGVAREQARKDLTLSTYTEAYWKVDLHNLLHFLQLRMDAHAQEEIRAYANVIGDKIVARWVPATWEAFCDYRLGATMLTRLEKTILLFIQCGRTNDAKLFAQSLGWLDERKDGTLKPNRECTEAEEKLRQLGVPVPWNA